MNVKHIFTQDDISAIRTGQKLEDAIFDGCSFKNVSLPETEFDTCSFAKCDMTGAKFNSSVFINCNFNGTVIMGTNLFSAMFTECKFTGVTLSRAGSILGVKFLRSTFEYCDVRSMDLSKQDLSHSSFFECDFSLSNLKKTNFMNSRVINCVFAHAKFEFTDFRGSEIAGFDLKTQNLKGVILTPHQIRELATILGIHIMESE